VGLVVALDLVLLGATALQAAGVRVG
jgi:hypothetical protein